MASYGEPSSYPSYDRAPPAVAGGQRTRVNSNSPVYAIDFSAQAAGKRIATTKRRIRWRWGFSNAQALEQGQTGTACRGEEHEVVLVWSVTSGKRQITMDGQEVHYSASRSGVIDFSWSVRGNHVIKITAHAAPPMSASPNFRQYDLYIDGQSFFSMPKVFELGLKGQIPTHARRPGDVGQYQRDQYKDQEEADLQRAIQESIAESRRHLSKDRGIGDGYSVGGGSYGGGYPAPSPAPHDQAAGADLLDLDTVYSDPGAGALVAMAPNSNASYAGAPAPAMYAPAPAVPTYTPAPPVAAAPLPALTYGAPPAAPVPPVAVPPAPVHVAPAAPIAPTYPPATPNTVSGPPQGFSQVQTGELLSPGVTSTASAPPAYGFPVQQPMHAPDDPFAPKAPTQNDLHNAILGAYGTSDQQTPTTPGTPGVVGVPTQPNFHTPAPAQENGHPNLTMNAPLAIQSEEEAPKSEMDSALKNLVNFDDINSPAEREMKLTMAREEEKKKRKGNKSHGLPPVANNMVGTGATLSQIQQVKPTAAAPDPTSIMKPAPHMFHQNAATAGALVVHGEGPPPLQPQGFGMVHGQGYYGHRQGY